MPKPTRYWLDSWQVGPSSNRDYDVIDGLRGVAILLVAGCHLVYVNPASASATRFFAGIMGAGYCGVTVFFALSGFLISWPFWKRKVANAVQIVPPGYGWRRFWKIVPPLVLSLVVLTPLTAVMLGDSSVWKIAVQWLLGVPLVAPVSSKLNPVMWSLAVEIQFYIILPLLFLSLRRISAKSALWLLFFVLLVVPTSFRWLNASLGSYVTTFPQVDMRFPSILDAFAFGVLMAGLDNFGLLRKRCAQLGDLGLIVLAFSLVLISWVTVYTRISEPTRVELSGWLTKAASALLLCYVADPEYPRVRALSQPWLRWCGIISYEWYLFHQPIILWTRQILGPAGGSPLKYICVLSCGLGAGIVVAALVYWYFSLPLLKYGRAKHSAKRELRKVPAAHELQVH